MQTCLGLITGKQYDCYLYKCFNCKPPGLYHMTLPKSHSGKETYLSNSYHLKAKEGLSYWKETKTYPISKCRYKWFNYSHFRDKVF